MWFYKFEGSHRFGGQPGEIRCSKATGIHSKSEKPADSTFQSPKICGKKCVNFDGKILRQKRVNYKNHKNLVSMWHFADSIVCFNVFIDYLLQ